MATVISLANQKGGSAKTTTAIHLGAALSSLGQRVLLVDMDPQGHLAEGFGLPTADLTNDISNVLDGKSKLADIILQVRPNLDLAPSTIRLSYLEAHLFTKYQRENRLKNALKPIVKRYDSILIDCPPSLGILTVNALSAADYVLIPMACEFFAMLGVSLLLQTIEEMRAEINPDLQILGILPTRSTRTTHCQEVLERLSSELGGTIHIYSTVIPESTKFREATVLGKTMFEHVPESKGAEAYFQVAKEVSRNA
jgi:chromosome partitioning protein